jgi:hypothetical protein
VDWQVFEIHTSTFDRDVDYLSDPLVLIAENSDGCGSFGTTADRLESSG